jgi:hypothetical protein
MHEKAIQLLIQSVKKGLGRADFYNLYEAVSDFQTVDDSMVLHGTITRGGAFEYKNGVNVPGFDKPVLFKDYKQLKGVFQKYGHLPAFDSHGEHRIVGFATNWEYDDKRKLVDADVHVFPEIEEELSINGNDGKDIPVSIRMNDMRSDHAAMQDITDVLHLAVSLDKTDRDRCSTAGGHSCRVSLIQSQGATASDFVDDDDGKKGGKKQARGKKMPKDTERDEGVDESEEEEEVDDAKPDVKEKPKDDFVKLSKEEYAELLTIKSQVKDMKDFIDVLQEEKKKSEVQKTVEMREALKKDGRLAADFVDKASLEVLEQIKAGLVPIPENGRLPRTGRDLPADFAGKKPEFKKNRWGTNMPQEEAI